MFFTVVITFSNSYYFALYVLRLQYAIYKRHSPFSHTMSTRVSIRLADRAWREALAAENEAWRAWEASGMSAAALLVAREATATATLAYDKISDAYEMRRMRHQA